MTGAGARDQRIAIQAPQVSRSAMGAEVITWVTTATVWGGITTLSGRELYTAQQIVAEATKVITIAYRRGVRPKMRALLGARVLDVLYVEDPGERHEELRLLVKEMV